MRSLVFSRSGTFRNAVVSLVVLIAATTGSAAPAAHAAAPSSVTALSCEGTDTATYSPPLVNTPRPTAVSLSEDLDYCLLGGVVAGNATATFNVTVGCTSAIIGAFPLTYHWQTGQSSTVDYTTTSVTRLANGSDLVVATGTVESGFDQGATATAQIVEPALDVTACSGSGVSQVTGPMTLTFA